MNKIKKTVTSMKDGTFLFRLKDKVIRNRHKDAFPILHDYHSLAFLEKKYGKYLDSLPVLNESDEEKEKIIWWCWLQGEEKAPELCKQCLNSLRRHYSDYKIIVITNENLSDYIEFPNYIKDKYEKGIITRTHYSDLIRVQLLVQYGGTWIDSSVYCTGRSSKIEDSSFFVYKSFLTSNETMSASSWLISSKKSNPILTTTRDLLFEYWKTKDTLINYFLFHLFFTMARKKYDDLWNELDNVPNSLPHILQFEMFNDFNQLRMNEIKSLSNFHKLSQKITNIPKSKNKTYYQLILNGSEL